MVIFVCLIVLQSAFSEASKSRSVNLALETILEFDNDNDVEFIDTMQMFLDKIKRTVIRNRAMDEHSAVKAESNATDEKELKFTDFLAETVTVLKSYNDDDLVEFFRALDSEMEIRRKDDGFKAIADAVGFRRLLSTHKKKLKLNLSPRDIRAVLNDISRKIPSDDRHSQHNFIADFLNFFYRKKSQAKLSRFLTNLKLYRTRTRRSFNLDLKRIIRSGIQALLEPVLKLNVNFNDEFTESNDSHISDNSNTNENYNSPSKFIKQKIGKSSYIIQKQINMAAKNDKTNEVVDYIENQKSIIEKHITTDGYATNAKENLKSKNYDMDSHSKGTKKKRKLKSKYSHFIGGVEVEHKRNKQKHSTGKTTENANMKRDRKRRPKIDSNEEENIDLSEVKEPLLIKIGTSDELYLETEDDHQSTTQRTKQRRYKKFTRRRTTKKPLAFAERTSAARKQFKTTMNSDEGLSIEHFGSLVSIKPMRKSNNDDNMVINTTLSYEGRSRDVTTLITTQDRLSSETKKYNLANSVDEFPKRTESISRVKPLDLDIISEKIRLKGDIVFETNTAINQRTKNSHATTATLKIVDGPPEAKLNAINITTRNTNAAKIKPTIVFKAHKSNETEVNITTATSLKIDTTTLISTASTKTELKTDKAQVKTNDDNLENELEDMIDRFNKSSTLPDDMLDFLKDSERNNKDKNNNEIQKQMKLDFEKLLAPTTAPSTKSKNTEMFTDPFDDIDDAFSPY